jgi:ATP-dependent 26S proteasome regulatory subunit
MVFPMILQFIATFDNITNFNSAGLVQKKIEKDQDKDIVIDEKEEKDIENNNKKEDQDKFRFEYDLHLKSSYGSYSIIFNNEIIDIDYNISDQIVGTRNNAQKYETLKISSKFKKTLLDFVEESRKYCIIPKPEPLVKYISIKQYDVQLNKWNQLSQLKKRSISSVFLDKDQVDNLKNDIDKFLDSEEIYDLYGIPYKRNYLLYGIPGTGKTSLIFSIASELNMGVSIFSFVPGIDDTIFMKCINSIPSNSILLLEDIDGVFINRERDYNNKSMISFSGILNTLDGMGRKDKLITFMTTNFKEQLDDALIRPGRIDYKLEFTYATQYQISKMFDLFIKNDENKNKFLNHVKNKKITTCILQKFFFEYREEHNIMDKIDILDLYIVTYTENGKNLYM